MNETKSEVPKQQRHASCRRRCRAASKGPSKSVAPQALHSHAREVVS